MVSYSVPTTLRPGDVVAARELPTVAGSTIRLPDAVRLVHLQFRRFSGCPVCNLHLRSFARRHDEIVAAGIQEVAVFHSPPDELRPHTAELPFAVVPDGEMRLYAEFGVQAGRRALLDPRAWPTIVLAVVADLWRVVRRGQPLPASSPNGGRLGLPADFLIASDGRIVACTYGEHADDQWSVDELLALAGGTGPLAPVRGAPASGSTC